MSETDSKLDLILHPIRLRILTRLSGQRMTVQQIARALPDVPQATLYRQVKTLADGGLLVVVEENQVRGTVEKVYGLYDEEAIQIAHDGIIPNISRDDHMRYFITFVLSLIRDFSTYLDRTETVDFGMQGVEYRSVEIFLSDPELRELAADITDLLTPLREHRPESGRKRRVFSTVLTSGGDDPSP
jgi:DNA-binding transcriptional ArsR family regulator